MLAVLPIGRDWANTRLLDECCSKLKKAVTATLHLILMEMME